ncbi:ferritin-like domain-containing protein, partial [bacterium]
SNNNGGGGSGTSDPTINSLPGKNGNVKVLNYALTLEILEADLYRQALNLASGRPLNDNDGKLRDASAYVMAPGVGNLGAQSAAGFAYLRDFAFVEAAHRDFLRTAILGLGDTPVSPNAKGYQFGKAVAPNLRAILRALLPLEETGTRAYLGAAPFFVNFESAATKNLIKAAVGIYSTEARHSAALHYVLESDIGPNGTEAGVPSNSRVSLSGSTLPYSDQGLGDTFEYFSTPASVVAAIQPLIVK